MVLTPLHYSLAYLFHKVSDKLSFPALIVSSMVPDLETILETGLSFTVGGGFQRGLVLHSLFGAVTVGLVVAVALTGYLYPHVVSHVFRVDRKIIAKKCRFSSGLVVSCFIGLVTHVLVDTLHHPYNPFLFPFSNSSFDALVLFSNPDEASSILHVIFVTLSLGVLLYELYRGTDGFWKRVLVE